MKAAIRDILQHVPEHPVLMTESAVVSYFDQFIWSSEKEEWEKLTAQEKQVFIDQLDAVKVKVCDLGNGREYLWVVESRCGAVV